MSRAEPSIFDLKLRDVAGASAQLAARHRLRLLEAFDAPSFETETHDARHPPDLSPASLRLLQSLIGRPVQVVKSLFRIDPSGIAINEFGAPKDANHVLILNLTVAHPWAAEWGGLVLFEDKHGQIAEGWPPRPGAADLISCHQRWHISAVAQEAPHFRRDALYWLSILG